MWRPFYCIKPKHNFIYVTSSVTHYSHKGNTYSSGVSLAICLGICFSLFLIGRHLKIKEHSRPCHLTSSLGEDGFTPFTNKRNNIEREFTFKLSVFSSKEQSAEH